MSQMKHFLRQLPLLALALTGTSLLTAGPLAAAQAGSRFAAPDGSDQGAVSAVGEAKGGNGGGKGGNGGGNGNGGKGGNGGNGGGNGGGGNGGGGNGGGGNGGGGNGGGGNGGGTKALDADVQPNVWNTNYENSQGTISVAIRGGGLSDIDTSSIVLVGAEGTEPLSPTRIQRNKSQIRAFFAKADAIALLETPERGETHELTVEFSVDGDDGEVEAKSLTVKVRIVGPGGGGDDDDDDEETELEMQVQPGTWNTNWSRSKGTVSVKITGSGLGDVDLDSIVLIGTDAEAEPLSALRARHNGNHIRVYFAKSEVLDILDTPKSGETHTVTLRLTAATSEGDAELELTDTIRIVGPGQ